MRHCITVVAILIASAYGASAGQGIEKDGSVFLPSQTRAVSSFNVTQQLMYSSSDPWQRFVEQHGAWGVVWNERTGTPHRAYGDAIRLSGFSLITSENVADAAMVFINANSELLKVQPEDLRLIRTTEVHGRWYVTYRQVKDGIDVLFSELELRIFSNGNVMAFGSDFYTNVSVSTLPSISYEDAQARAAEGLESPMGISGEGTLYILPIDQENRTDFHLAYEVYVSASNPPGNYIALVDAHDGSLLWRHNRVRYTDVTGRVTGMVQLDLPTDPFVEEGLFDQYVTIGGVMVRTDSLGYYRRDISSSSTLTASLFGPYVNVNRNDGPDAFFSTTVDPGDTLDILWDDGNSHPAERDGFFHTNIIHTFITTLDPNFTFINYSMGCAVNINSTCNAYWDGSGINFFDEGGGCPNTAQMPDVVYHEYGHGINDKLYQQLGSPFGMINGATHEGMADVAASVVLDDSRVGRGFFGPGSVLRDLDNMNRYPQNVSGDPHITGLIIGGAFWDLRETTDLETYQYLTHFAKYGLPDDEDDGTAFSEWFVETLVADDDDGNIGNGTPHMSQIVNAFNLHGIGSELYYRSSFSHTPLPNTTDTTQGYLAVFALEGVPVGGGDPDSVQVVYSTDGFQTAQSVFATLSGFGEYEAEIPAQPWGSLVKYYMTAYDFLSSSWYNFPSTAPADSAYKFLVGSQPAEAGVMYAGSTANPSGSLYTIDLTSGEVTLIGSLGIRELQSLAVRPSTGDLYGTYTAGSTTSLFKISPILGDALLEIVVPLANLRAITFGENDTLYGVTSTGSLYRIDITTGSPTLLGTTTGNFYWGLASNPITGDLWASIRFLDRIYTINRSNAAPTLIGETGFNTTTSSIAFDPQGRLFGITATNQFISIDTATAVGSPIGSPSVTGIIALAMRSDSLILSIEESQTTEVPNTFSLSQNYPNPFNPATEIRYGLPEQSQVTISVFDLLGQEVCQLLNGVQTAGNHVVIWGGGNAAGIGMASGIYFYRMEARGEHSSLFAEVRKMLLLR